MTMTTEAAAQARGARERLQYNLNTVLTFLTAKADQTEGALSSLIAYLKAAQEDDGVIDAEESARLLNWAYQAKDTHRDEQQAVRLLDVSGTEQALLETERIRRIELAAEQVVKRKKQSRQR